MWEFFWVREDCQSQPIFRTQCTRIGRGEHSGSLSYHRPSTAIVLLGVNGLSPACCRRCIPHGESSPSGGSYWDGFTWLRRNTAGDIFIHSWICIRDLFRGSKQTPAAQRLPRRGHRLIGEATSQRGRLPLCRLRRASWNDREFRQKMFGHYPNIPVKTAGSNPPARCGDLLRKACQQLDWRREQALEDFQGLIIILHDVRIQQQLAETVVEGFAVSRLPCEGVLRKSLSLAYIHFRRGNASQRGSTIPLMDSARCSIHPSTEETFLLRRKICQGTIRRRGPA